MSDKKKEEEKSLGIPLGKPKRRSIRFYSEETVQEAVVETSKVEETEPVVEIVEVEEEKIEDFKNIMPKIVKPKGVEAGVKKSKTSKK